MVQRHGGAAVSDDPRVVRTRHLLQETLLDLGRERDLNGISIADITTRARVSRSTFYDHYTDRDELLADALDQRAEAAGVTLTAAGLPEEFSAEPPEVLVRYAEHVAEDADLYRRALSASGSAAVQWRLRRRITTFVTDALRFHADETGGCGLPIEIAAAAHTGTFLGVIGCWLEMDPLPPPRTAAGWAWTAFVGIQEDC